MEAGRSDSEASVIKLNSTSFLLDELKRWTEYRIWVLAGTSVGDGPSSYPITVRTHEDGTFLSFTFIPTYTYLTYITHLIIIILRIYLYDSDD